MLNISENSVVKIIRLDGLLSLEMVKERPLKRWVKITFLIFLVLTLSFLFLPWTQIVSGNGSVTTLRPDQRPQELHSAIAGRIEKWYTREGEYVEKGDTLLFISEVKDEYFDPSLLQRTQSQIDAKEFSVGAYKGKVQALGNQILALQQSKKFKMEQAFNKISQAILKIRSDSIDVEAARTQYQIAERQNERLQLLFDQGLKSLTDLETRKLKLKESQAKLISAENKLLTSENELLNARVEFSSVRNELEQKIAKAQADKFETLSGSYDAEVSVTKLRNAYTNYSMRTDLYFIRAPQSGYVTQTIKAGLGETIKEGEEILTIMPSSYDAAVEMHVEPRDLPLVSKGSRVRLIFDGWPALVFSGWPGISTGTFAGKVVALDNFAGKNGKFRLLVAEDQDEIPWPEALRVGSGVKGMVMLKDVSVWYELWRRLNGFPPEFYQPGGGKGSSNLKKEAK